MSYANNKGGDQPAHARSLMSAFVPLPRLCNVFSFCNQNFNLMLASVAEQASLSLAWSETPEDTFSHDEAHINYMKPFLCISSVKLSIFYHLQYIRIKMDK